MAAGVLMVYANCREGDDEAFNRWYDEVHLADVCAVPGVVGAQRFRLAGQAPLQQALSVQAKASGDEPFRIFRYLCIYELADQRAAECVVDEIKKLGGDWRAAGRTFEGVESASAIYVAQQPATVEGSVFER